MIEPHAHGRCVLSGLTRLEMLHTVLAGRCGVSRGINSPPGEPVMDAFLSSTLAVAIAEIGDKTQLLTLFLAARFACHGAIIAGILAATLLNHALSAWLGTWLVQWVPAHWLPWVVGLSFVAVGLWVLIPDREDGQEGAVFGYGAFIASCMLFFMAEIGDKTQVATVILAASYESLFPVVTGSTLGMLLANVPVVYTGSWLMQKLPLGWIRMAACLLFVGLGGLALFTRHSV